MAAIDDLIAQIDDPRLRADLAREWAAVQRKRQFGLVFDRHLPELVPVPRARPRRGELVAKRGGSLTELWRVRRVTGAQADCVRADGQPAAGDPWTFALADLVVVRRFGEPIYPALTPLDAVQNGPAAGPWHSLIEADNFHALQLLGYLYAGQVDCIYIDPPYNTGARDWKYNNDYVDRNDPWRHSKWLSFMERRLLLAKRLLKAEGSVLIVAIDEKEYMRLALLLEQVFPDATVQMISTATNPAGVARAGAFGRSDEYIFFVTVGGDAPQRVRLSREWVSAKGRTHTGNIRWDLLRRSGEGAARKDSPGCFYAIYVDARERKIARIGEALPHGVPIAETIPGYVPILPIRKDGSEGRWQWTPSTLRERMAQGRVRVSGSIEKGFVVSILKDGEYAKIERGEFQEIGRGADGSLVVDSINTDFVLAVPASQWRITTHDATQYGSRLLAGILPEQKFPFPKSVYAVRDSLNFFVANKADALIVDFFAGSGTTLNAVNLLNAADGGNRRCILVTNNEVGGEEADALAARGLQPGDPDWEAAGICRSVTWPRSKFTILGRRDDGTPLPGEYLTGRTRERERARNIRQIGFVAPGALDGLASRKQLVALLDGLPQTLVSADAAFIVSADHPTSVLFDPAAADDWLAALDGQAHLTDLYIVTSDKRRFDALKTELAALLGPLTVPEEDKRPLATGFPANLVYYKLEFLDKDQVALKRAFNDILPLLWLRAGAVGSPPAPVPAGAPLPACVAPVGNAFAVLLDEDQPQALLAALAGRAGLRCLFLVTDAADAFRELSALCEEALGPAHPGLVTVQLYRDYLDNFRLNALAGGEDGA